MDSWEEDAVSPGRSQPTIVGYTETGEAAQSRRPLAGPTPSRGSRFDPTYDDLLQFAVWWVTENRGRGRGFVAEVAVAFDMLKGEVSWVTRLLESHAKLAALATDNIYRSSPVREKR
jgi:hypothetical protein